MERWKEGDPSKGVCQICGVTELTFKRRDVSYEEESLTIVNLLCGVCNNCDQVISIPQQSVSDLQEQLNKSNL